MGDKELIFEKEDDIAVITLHRPAARNALSLALLVELTEVMDHIDADESIRAIVLTGGKKYFCAGFDLKQLGDFEGKSKAPIIKIVDQIRAIQKRFEYCTRPVIAAICGPALAGGFELAISCDLRVASETSIFGLPEIRFGGLGYAGATQRLPRLIPVGLAKEIHLLGEPISAQEAHRIGLVNRVYPNDAVLDEAKKMAKKIALYSPSAVKVCKFLINTGMKLDVTTAMDYETEFARYLTESPEFDESRRKAAEREGLYAHIFRKNDK